MVLKVKNIIVVSVLVVYPCDHVADRSWGSMLLPSITWEYVTSPGKEQNSKSEFSFY